MRAVLLSLRYALLTAANGIAGRLCLEKRV
jgi:hypothetical protein